MIRVAAMGKTILLAQGVLAILFGLAAMTWPDITTLVLAYLFAAFLLVDGIVLILLGLAWKTPRARTRVWLGVLQLLVGLYVAFNPHVTIGVLIIILGIALMVRGVFNLIHAATWTHDDPGDRLLHGVLGLLGLIIGAVIAVQPTAGGLAFVWILGLYAVATGAVLIALGTGVGRAKAGPHSHPRTRR